MRTFVFVEALIVGVMTLALYHALAQVTTGALTLFLTGALMHIALEIAGLNEQWCRTTYK